MTMTNSLINIAQVLTERVNENKPTEQSAMHINIDGKKQLNYEIMFQLLQGEVEKHILENQGNQVVDEFKQKIITKFSTLIQQLNNYRMNNQWRALSRHWCMQGSNYLPSHNL